MSPVHFPNGLQHLRPGAAHLGPDQQGRGLLHQQGDQEHQQEQQVSQRYGQSVSRKYFYVSNIFNVSYILISQIFSMSQIFSLLNNLIENGQKCGRCLQYSEQENSAVVEDHSEKCPGFSK